MPNSGRKVKFEDEGRDSGVSLDHKDRRELSQEYSGVLRIENENDHSNM